MGKFVDHGLGNVRDDCQPSAHITVKRAVANAEFGFVSCGKEKTPEFIGNGHKERPTDTGLDILACHFGSNIFKNRREFLEVFLEYSFNRHMNEFNPQISCKISGVFKALPGCILRRHKNTHYIFPAKGLHRNRGSQRRINAPAQPYHGPCKSALMDIISGTHDKGL